jgi:hypothetical protein
MPAPMVKGNSFGNFSVPRSNVRLLWMNALYASAVGSLMSIQIRPYPDIVYVSRLFWQKSSPYIDHWNRVKNVGLMLRKKEQVLSSSCEYNVKFWQDV